MNKICKECGKLFTPKTKNRSKRVIEGRKFCSSGCSAKSVLREFKKNNPEKAKETYIKNLPKENSGENNGNWKGGKTKEYKNYRIQNNAEYNKWRKKCLERDRHKCKLCNSLEKLQVHHIIPISLLRKAAWEVWNGVTLCRKCHVENDKCISEGRRYSDDTISKLSSIKVMVFVIRSEFQEYRTAGNYKELCDGTIVYLITKQVNKDYEFLILIHEMVEFHLCKMRGIKEKDIDKYDKYWEIRKENGLAIAEEPGNEKDCIYAKEHRFSENIERQLAHEMSKVWKEYDDKIIPRDLI